MKFYKKKNYEAAGVKQKAKEEALADAHDLRPRAPVVVRGGKTPLFGERESRSSQS